MSNGDQVQEGSRSGRVFAVTLTLLAVSFSVVFARLFTRIAILKRTSWDDYFISLAWVTIQFLLVIACQTYLADMAERSYFPSGCRLPFVLVSSWRNLVGHTFD